MATISNRFDSLLINAKNPLEKSKKKEKTKAEPRAPKKLKQKPEPVVVEVEKPVVVQEIKTKPIKSSRVVVTDITKKEEIVPSPPKVEVKVHDVSVPEELDTFAHEYKDRQKSAYRKMIVTRGRVFERHSAARGGQHEKRHGHGAFNWGEQTDVNETKEADESVQVQEEENKEVSSPVQYTIEQYKKMCEEQMIDPLTWQEQKDLGTVVEERENVKEYEYYRNYDSQKSRGRSRGGPGRRGRGSTRERNSSFNERNVELKVDDIHDFPAL